MIRVAAIVPTFTPQCLTWFGTETYLKSTVDRLHDVRGIDSVALLTTPTQKKFDADDVCETCQVVEIPAKPGLECRSTLIPVLAKLKPLAEYHILMVVNPLCPFIKPARVEECLELVRKRKADLAYTARRFPSLEVTGREVAQQARDRLIDAVYAFRPAKLDFAKGSWSRNSRAVLVNAIESLDATNREDAQIAAALKAQGQ